MLMSEKVVPAVVLQAIAEKKRNDQCERVGDWFHCRHAMLMSKTVAVVIRKAMVERMKKCLEKAVVDMVERMDILTMYWREVFRREVDLSVCERVA